MSTTIDADFKEILEVCCEKIHLFGSLMSFFSKKPSLSFFKKLLHQRHVFINATNFNSSHALQFLNITQFFGVVNDNVFKFLTLFLLIDLQGIVASSKILFWVGTVYVLPFLLFSSAAGILADKFSKQKMIVFLKAIEVVTTALAIIAFALKSPWGCYTLLFFLALHSAAFGPPKYSIIPELVPAEKISKANGVITSFTYLGMIVGTFLATFITQITSKNFTIAASMCLVIALLGFFSSLLIPYTKPAKAKTSFKFFFLKEIHKTLSFCYQSPHLLLTVLGAAFFLYIGAFFQLNIIPFAIQALSLSEVGGGYLFLTVAVGIAIGAVLVGKLSKNRVELGFSCIACFLLFVFVLSLALLPKTVKMSVVLLVLIGFVSGFFIVPLDAYIQKYSPDSKRGQVVATSNFMSFCGVLLAPFSIYIFGESFGLSASQGFLMISFSVLIVAYILLLRLLPVLLSFIGRKYLSLVYNISVLHSPFERATHPLLILPQYSFKKLCLLAGHHESLHIVILRHSFKLSDLLYRLFACIDIIYIDDLASKVAPLLEKTAEQQKTLCLCIPKTLDLQNVSSHIGAINTFTSLYVHMGEGTRKHVYKKEMMISFVDHPLE